ncbi:MAG TPA: shikimate dehydrogenase [Solirubrobacteraceae bacterium]|nr:shikimate dehydrogenase [Solirubrobacteraceae bacterium]
MTPTAVRDAAGGPAAARGPRLGVLGWPVSHSLSPVMHNAALRAVGLHAWRYQLLPVVPSLLAEVVRALAAAGFVGANATIPHKRDALLLATEATERARAIGAANTLTFGPGGSIAADNTDAPALIDRLPVPAAGRTALVLGAGGSARAAVWALLDAGAAEVAVLNRTAERARELCAELGATPVARPRPADLVVNCTSAELGGGDPLRALGLDPGALSDYGCVADLVYVAGGSRLVRAARERAIPTVDGLELLVAQGALSFERFTGRRAPVDVMRAAVHAGGAPSVDPVPGQGGAGGRGHAGRRGRGHSGASG